MTKPMYSAMIYVFAVFTKLGFEWSRHDETNWQGRSLIVTCTLRMAGELKSATTNVCGSAY